MSKKLITVTEMYRIDSEAEVESFLQELKEDYSFELSKYSSVKKEKKKGGEVYDSWYRLTVTKVYGKENDE